MSFDFKIRKRVVAVIVFVGLVTAINVVAYLQVSSMTYFVKEGTRTAGPEDLSLGEKLKTLLTGVTVPRPDCEETPRSIGLEFESIRIPVNDETVLGAWYCSHPESQTTTILFHGYAASKSSLLEEARLFHELGHGVLLVDFRGSCESSKSYTTIGFHEATDVASAMHYAKNRWPKKRIVLFGKSMGASAVLGAVHNHGIEPDAIIIESVFDTLLHTIENRFDAMGLPSFPFAQLLVFWGGWIHDFNGFDHNPLDYAASVKAPILFMHGVNDPRVLVEEGRSVFEAVPGSKEFKKFLNVGHISISSQFPKEWQSTVNSFLKNQAPSLHCLTHGGR